MNRLCHITIIFRYFVRNVEAYGSNDKLLIGNFYRSPNSSLESDEKLYSLLNLICNKFTGSKIFVGDFNFPTLIGLHYKVCLLAAPVIFVIICEYFAKKFLNTACSDSN